MSAARRRTGLRARVGGLLIVSVALIIGLTALWVAILILSDLWVFVIAMVQPKS